MGEVAARSVSERASKWEIPATDRGDLAMRILLVQPGIRPGQIGFHVAAQTEPLALETLAATLPDHDVKKSRRRSPRAMEKRREMKKRKRKNKNKNGGKKKKKAHSDTLRPFPHVNRELRGIPVGPLSFKPTIWGGGPVWSRNWNNEQVL